MNSFANFRKEANQNIGNIFLSTYYRHRVVAIIKSAKLGYGEGGSRQGDPLAPYRFVICVEMLTIVVKSNERIKGGDVSGKEYVIFKHADEKYFT